MQKSRCASRLSVYGLFGPALLLLLWVTTPGIAFAWPWDTKWRDVTPEERAMTEPKIDPEAGVEYLISEMEVDETLAGRTTYTQYLRLKVFDERGVGKLKQIDIDAGWNETIRRAAVRVIRPDGTIEEMPKDIFHDREVIRQGREKMRAKSFSIPNLEPGTIIEYQFERTRDDYYYIGGIPYVLNEAYPVHVATLLITPYPDMTGVNYVYNGSKSGDFEKIGGGGRKLTLHDLPAISREPFLPPFYETVSWLMVTYVDKPHKEPMEYWEGVANRLYNNQRDWIKGRKRAVRDKALALTDGVDGEKEKLRCIYDFCVSEIENLSSDWNNRSAAEMDDLKKNDDPADTLEHMYGNAFDIDFLFASLCEAAGFDVRVVFANNHSLTRFSMNITNQLAIPSRLIAVKVGEDWTLHDPGNLYLGFLQLSWRNEYAACLLADRKEARFLVSPISSEETNNVIRSGTFTLSEEGTLEGDISLRYAGHWAPAIKNRLDGFGTARLEEEVEENIKKALPQAELSNITFKHLRHPTEPVTMELHVVVPNYADATSKRLFIQTNPFEFMGIQAGGGDSADDFTTYSMTGMNDLLVRTPVFVAEEREHPVYVPYNFSVDDDIRIKLPEGYALEEATAPAGNMESAVCDHTIFLGFSPNDHSIVLRRHFKLMRCEIPVEKYPVIRNFFKALQERDRHILTVRKES